MSHRVHRIDLSMHIRFILSVMNSRKIKKFLLIFDNLNLNISKVVYFCGATVMHQLIHITWPVIFVMLSG